MAMDELEARLGVEIKDQDLWSKALTHRSYAHEEGLVGRDNERLEFLGDAVIELAVREYLFRTFPERSEGDMALIRTAVVRTETLAEVAMRLDLGDFIMLGKGEEHSGGRRRISLLSDTYEAIVAAVFVEHGWETAKNFVLKTLAVELNKFHGPRLPLDPKSELQERLQAQYKKAPSYRLVSESGPDHDRLFITEVVYEGKVLGRGMGRSRRRSEQNAAANALQSLAHM